MPWTDPKTNWKPSDCFDVNPDYLRIRGNILHLKSVADRLYLPFWLSAMVDCSVEDTPPLSFYANLSGNVDTLLDCTYRPKNSQRGRMYRVNEAVWSDDDLNRIERALLTLKGNLQAQENARKPLKFTLGGGVLGSYI